MEENARLRGVARAEFELILRCVRNSPSAPNVLDTIAFAARSGLKALERDDSWGESKS